MFLLLTGTIPLYTEPDYTISWEDQVDSDASLVFPPQPHTLDLKFALNVLQILFWKIVNYIIL